MEGGQIEHEQNGFNFLDSNEVFLLTEAIGSNSQYFKGQFGLDCRFWRRFRSEIPADFRYLLM